MPTVQVSVLCTDFHAGLFMIFPPEKTMSACSLTAFQAQVLIAGEQMPGQNDTHTHTVLQDK